MEFKEIASGKGINKGLFKSEDGKDIRIFYLRFLESFIYYDRQNDGYSKNVLMFEKLTKNRLTNL